MKELYTKPEIEIELFKTDDIITTSDNDTPWPDEWNQTNSTNPSEKSRF